MKLAVLITLLPTLGVAAPATTFGQWCNEVGDIVLYFDAESLGIGDHRVCEWQKVPGETRTHNSNITCHQFKFDGEKHVAYDEQKYEFIASLDDDDHLSTTFDDGNEVFPFTYIRCDW